MKIKVAERRREANVACGARRTNSFTTRLRSFMRTTTLGLVVVVAIHACTAGTEAQESWPRFRGPNGSGVSTTTATLPVEFGPNKNLAWRTTVDSGHSSPVIFGDRIFLTASTDNQFEVLCLNAPTGEILWRKELPQPEPERVHKINTRASPTAVVDATRVYVYFGTLGVVCFDHAGTEQWKRPLETPLRNLFGTASSLMLLPDKLIFTCDNETDSFIEALDPVTGDVIWHKPRKGLRSSWSTPVVLENNGSTELLVYGVSWLTALDPKDGSDRWSVPGLADEPAITPAIGDGLVFVSSYNMNSNSEVIGIPPFADLLKQLDKDGNDTISFDEGAANRSVLSRNDADGEGDHPLRLFYRMLDENRDKEISSSEYVKLSKWLNSFEQENGLIAIRPPAKPGQQAEVVWRHRTGVPEVPSPLYYRGRIHLVKNGGIATCLNATTGKQIYQQRLKSGGPYYASPISANGQIYAASARGVVTVMEAGDTLKVLARNKIGQRIMATPAIVGDRIYVRTESQLMAFGLSNVGEE